VVQPRPHSISTRSPLHTVAHVCGAADFETGAIFSVMRIFLCSEKMQRNIRLIAHDPTVMPGTDVKDVPWLHDIRPSIFHGACSLSGNHQADVLHLTKRSPCNWCDMLRPFPAGFISRPSNCHPADLNEFESAFLKSANLIRILKSFD